MLSTTTEQAKPPPRITRQRGPRPRSTNPAVRLDEAMAILQERRADLIQQAERLAIELTLQGRSITADDLRGIETGEIHRQFVGRALLTLAQLGILRAVGYRNSEVPGNHARPVRIWQMDDRAAAERWLRDHPLPKPLPNTQLTMFGTAEPQR